MICVKDDKDLEPIRSEVKAAKDGLTAIEGELTDLLASADLPSATLARLSAGIGELRANLSSAEGFVADLALALGVQVGAYEDQPNDPLGRGEPPLRNVRWQSSTLDDRASAYFRRAVNTRLQALEQIRANGTPTNN